MKKAIALSLILGTVLLALPFGGISAAPAGPQDMLTQDRQDQQDRRNDRRDRRNNRRGRTTTTTRIVREGRWRYRETIRTTYLPNGRTRTEVISRERIR